ncbi:zinc finger protein 275-like isoform X2 [Amblyomma americanum]
MPTGSANTPKSCWHCTAATTAHSPAIMPVARHERTHIGPGEQFFVCQVCQKSFTLPGLLNQHLRYHTAEKWHKCADCGELFRHQSSLEETMKKVAKENGGIKPKN